MRREREREAFCGDWDSRGGCARCEACGKKHDSLFGGNLHWAIESDLVRRGERKNRPSRVLPGDVDGIIDKLRENNQRHHGEQPLVPPKAWWPKATGSADSAAPTPDSPQTTKESKSAKRDLEWESLRSYGKTSRLPAPLPGEGKGGCVAPPRGRTSVATIEWKCRTKETTRKPI